MDRSLRFRVCPHELVALFRLAFASAPTLNVLASLVRSNSPDHNAKGTQSPRRQPKLPSRLPPLVGTRFQVLFHSPPGVLFTFPSRYLFTIGRGRVFSLGGWSPRFQPGLLDVPGLLGNRHHATCVGFAYRALTFYGGTFQNASTRHRTSHGMTPCRPHNPEERMLPGLGFSPFARRYSENLV